MSCPHYLAEIVIYAGLALLTAGSTNALLMLFWVVRAAALRCCALPCPALPLPCLDLP